MADSEVKKLACGCDVRTYRDFLGRIVGTVLARGAGCARPEHAEGQTVIMPGRENARPE